MVWKVLPLNCLCVCAASVNYKDIMLATGKLPREADINFGALGFEFSGRVRTVCSESPLPWILRRACHLRLAITYLVPPSGATSQCLDARMCRS